MPTHTNHSTLRKLDTIKALAVDGLSPWEIARVVDCGENYVRRVIRRVYTKAENAKKEKPDMDKADASLRAADAYVTCEQWARKILSGKPGVHFCDLTSGAVKHNVRRLVSIIDSLLDGDADVVQMRDWLRGKGGAA